MDSHPTPPEGFQCPKQEDTVELQGTPGCKNCHHVLVKTPKTFHGAQVRTGILWEVQGRAGCQGQRDAGSCSLLPDSSSSGLA